jgi:hypothetical protein
MKSSALSQPPPIPDRVAASDEPGNNAAYEEYLRSFDEIPVLQDVVRIPPPRPRPPDFRRGERRDVRQEPRPDGYAARVASQLELELMYREYAQPAPAAPAKAKAKKKTTKPKAKRKTRKRSKE